MTSAALATEGTYDVVLTAQHQAAATSSGMVTATYAVSVQPNVTLNGDQRPATSNQPVFLKGTVSPSGVEDASRGAVGVEEAHLTVR